MKNFVCVVVALLLISGASVLAQSPTEYDAIPPTMVLVEGGNFTMGDTFGDGHEDELPLHIVSLSDFYISQTEVTVAQYRYYVEETGKPMPEAPTWGFVEDHPILFVSWHDAVDFCNWLSSKTGDTYRLPTESEWEYAARGGQESNGTRYSGSNSVNDVAWTSANSGETTKSVGTRQPNELGIYDMSGNVYEWTGDWMGDYPSGKATNPKGPSSGTSKVIRDVCYVDSPDGTRICNRNVSSPTDKSRYIGFRIAKDK